MFNVEASDQYFLERHGKFTASEIDKLLIKGKDEMFSAGGWTYIKQKANECLTRLYERPELEEVKSLMHGKMYEEPAYEAYVKFTKNHSMRFFGTYNPVYLPYNKDSGGSPDGLMGQEQIIKLGLEIKCPRDPNVHSDYLDMTNQFQLKEYNKKYYAQMQFLMMITGAPVFHFWSFDERFIDKRLQGKLIEVVPEIRMRDDIEMRVPQAIIERNKIIERKLAAA